MKRAAVILCLLLVACTVFWLFPLFHVVRLDAVQAAAQRTKFNAAEYVATYWNDRLLPSLAEAADTTAVLSAMDEDFESALTKFGRKSGVGRTTLLIVQGTGAIVDVDAKGIGVSLTQDGATPDVVLQTGLLFGNTARDATGLLDASDFENSRHFNEISTELNRHIETQVMPMFKDNATVGRQVRFVGCAEVPDNANNVRPLTLIPLVVSFN